MATFTQDDVDYLKSHGNDECAKTWLGLWDPKRAGHQDQRELMIDKYERKRYYLEPASPLKSLTNSVTLKTGLMAGVGAEVPTTSRAVAAVAAGAASKIASNDSSSYKNNIDDHIDLVKAGNGSGKNEQSTRNQYRQQNTNAERSFQLTPPSTQRTTMNGLHKVVTGETGSTGGSATTVTAISRPQQQHQQNDYNHLQNAFMQLCNNNKNNNVSNSNRNELNVLHMTTSRMSEGSSATSMNGFGVDTDFVADFGSANIFDATTSNSSKMSSPPKMNIGGSTITSNGYAKIKPLKKQQQKQKHQLLKGPGQTNGNMSQSNSIGNGTSANFADFDHAPIFNAGGK
ncbi:uncharacterized protein DDB_G0283357-like [Rhagoletis pomonella]|uniref:uncharacterized protein DDB_G0283357-like n=1 Tax=Rhagoletis pomonella TaxID=28610 RepID=UPI001783EA0E|nr:uncharacterized protein DDB_G0283357-like [Rhagoletis pomonella]